MKGELTLQEKDFSVRSWNYNFIAEIFTNWVMIFEYFFFKYLIKKYEFLIIKFVIRH